MTRKSDNERAFYVVQFIKLPFEGIDDFVCVPNTWLRLHNVIDRKAVVAYPEDEDPFETRERVKRKEIYKDEWRCFMAAIKYESDSYNDAAFWIATRNDCGPLTEEESKVTSKIQHTTTHDNGYQNLCSQKQLVDKSIQTNSKTKRITFMDNATRSSVTGSHLNVMQTDENMEDKTLSSYHVVTSDSDAVTNHKEIPDCEISTDESLVQTTNNVYVTINNSRCDSADKSTAAQNSTSTNHQVHPKDILKQQMLDNFDTLFTQMHSTYYHTADMSNTLRSSIFNTAESYKKLLGAVEQFNTAENAASNASILIPKVPQSLEEKYTKVSASASSSNQDQYNDDDNDDQVNDVANKMPKKKDNKLYRFVLPPEYDAYDTRWTLKYQTNQPGLVELMPHSRIYVSCGDLKYCQQVSKDCKSLARRLLTIVFNRNALSICSSITEKTQALNMRPELDNRACTVLLHFVLEHGLQRGWNTDLKPILSTLHSEMEEIRFKCGVMVEC